jgi:4-hydroxy-tetrahydrodipicolinate synthase
MESPNHITHPLSLRGVVPIIPTPFVPETEEVDFEALRRLIDFAVTLDVPAVCLPAYASEFYKLSETERFRLVEIAVEQAAGRVAIIAQSNHPSLKLAQEIARRNESLGADLISFAIPRIFGLGPDDVLDYCQGMCQAVQKPVLIQDFNPNGPTVGAEFARRLHQTCPNFRYLKLEEPLMGAKVTSIREATADAIGVLEGWGGMYTLELLPYGICGLMPGLAAADVLAHVWRLGEQQRWAEAMDVFQRILPQLIFSLQNMELFLHLEKRLLVARGVLEHAVVRRATLTPDSQVLAYGEFLNQRVLEAVADLKVA